MGQKQSIPCSEIIWRKYLSAGGDLMSELTEAQKYRRVYYQKNKSRELALSAAYRRANPEKTRNWAAAYRERCKDHIHTYNREYIRKRRLTDPDYGKRYYWGQKEFIKSKTRIRLLALKREVMDVYGKVCACCGENEIRFLALDHINNDGKQHRKELGGKVGSTFYRFLRHRGFPYRDRLQVLCYNCNGAKAYYGVCPHQLTENNDVRAAAL